MGNTPGLSSAKEGVKKGVEAVKDSRVAQDAELFGDAAKMLAECEQKEKNKDKQRCIDIVETTTEIRQLDLNGIPDGQEAYMAAFSMAIISIFGKLKAAGSDIDKIRYNPNLLHKELTDKGFYTTTDPKKGLETHERAALEYLPRVLNGKGPTAILMQKEWNEIVNQGHVAGGFKGALMESWEKHPIPTAIAVAGALTLVGCAAWAIFSKFKGGKEDGESESDDDSGKKSSWFSKRMLIPAGALVATLFGVAAAKNLLKFLTPDEIKELAEKGSEASEELKQKVEEGAKASAKKAREIGGVAAIAASGVLKHKEAEKAKENLKEEIEDPDNHFGGSIEAFLSLYFYHEEFIEDANIKNNFEKTLYELQTTKISTLKAIHSKYSQEEEIPVNAIPGVVTELSPKHLFYLVGGILNVQKRFEGEKGDKEEIFGFFVRIVNDPLRKMNSMLHAETIKSLKDGDIESALKGVNFDQLDKEIKKSSGGFIDAINKNLKIEVSDEDKPILRKIQLQLFLRENANVAPEVAVEKAIKRANIDNASESVTNASIDFYKNIQDKLTGTIIPGCHKQFAITEINGGAVKNNIAEGFTLDEITFAQGVQLVLAAEGMNWDEKDTKKTHWLKDFAILNIVLRAMPAKHRQAYIGYLAIKIGYAESNFDINIPGLQPLMPYLLQMKEFGKKSMIRKGTDILRAAQPLRDNPPSDALNHIDRMRKVGAMDTAIAFAAEAGSGGLQMASDSLAILIATAGITPQEIAASETAEDFIHLISSKNGTIIYPLDRPHQVAIQIGYKWFWAKPTGIIVDTLKAASEFDLEGGAAAAKIWTIGGSPFMVIGGWRALRNNTIPPGIFNRLIAVSKGVGRGFLYPVKAPYLIAKTPKMIAEATAKGVAGAREYTRRPFQYAGEVIRWTSDKVKYRKVWGGQNVASLMNNGKLLNYYKSAMPSESRTFKDFWVDLKDNKKGLMRRLSGNFNRNMAQRYAVRFAQRYNDFFRETRGFGARIDIEKAIDINKLDELQKAYRRLNHFFENFGALQKTAFKDVEDMLRKGGGKVHPNRIIERFGKYIMFLSDDEKRSIAKQLSTQEGFERFISRGKDFQKYAKNPHSLLRSATSKLSSRFGNKPQLKITKGLHSASMADAMDDLAMIQKQLKEAKFDLDAAKYAGKKGKFIKWNPIKSEEAIRKAKETLETAARAKRALKAHIKNMEEIRKLQGELKAAVKGTPRAKQILHQIINAKQTAKASMETAVKTTSSIKGAGKWSKLAKLGGRGLAIGGTALSAYEAASAFHEATTKSYIEGRSVVAGTKSALFAVDTAANVGAVAVAFGAKGALATTGATVAAPLAIVTYVGSSAYDSLHEKTMTEAEWSQKHSYDELVHKFFSTNGASVGDTWAVGFTNETVEGNRAGKKRTAHKIYRVLIASQKDQDLLPYVYSHKPSEETDKKIEKMIDDTYSIYHEDYFQSTHMQGASDYKTVRSMINDALLYDEIMKFREQKKAHGTKEFFIHENINLMDEKFDVSGTKERPKSKGNAGLVVLAYKRQILKSMESGGELEPNVFPNLESMETGYLLHLYAQMGRLLPESGDKKDALDEAMILIGNYLACSRNTRAALAARDPKFHKPKMYLETLMKHLSDFREGKSPSYVQFEKDHFTPNAGVLALARAAEFFGHKLYANQEEVEAAFPEEKASYQGIYHTEDGWYLQQRGLELDHFMGKKLDEKTVVKMLELIRKAPDDIFEHRQDSVFYDAFDYTRQSEYLANVIEEGLKIDHEKHAPSYKEGPQIEYAAAA